jgi:hypothetical protein
MQAPTMYEALIKKIVTSTGKQGESLATVTLVIESSEPESEFAALLGLQQAYCSVSFSKTNRKPLSMED